MIEQAQPEMPQMSENAFKSLISKSTLEKAQDPWAGRQSGMRCSTCIWFVSKEPQSTTVTVKSHQVGRCRRHAPTMGGYPVVYMTDWCGDHRVDENKV